MSWEAEAVRWANGLVGRWPVLDRVMYELADGWSPFLLIGLAVAYWIWREKREALVPVASLTAGILVADFLGARLKYAVARPRPCHVLDAWQDVAGCGAAFSMPSNHVLNTAVAAGFLQVLYPKSGWIMWPLVALQTFSRMFIAAHYPSDGVVGALMGAAIGVGTALLLLSWRRRRGGLSLAAES